MKLLILDVDGVMTDGTKLYGPDAAVIGKSMADIDFTAIRKFQMDGWKVIWMSSDGEFNGAIARKRIIEFWCSRNLTGKIDKVACLDDVVRTLRHRTDPPCVIETIVYVGDDLFDIPIMREIVDKHGGQAFCPKDAAPQVRQAISRFGGRGFVLDLPGGHGAIMDLYANYFATDDSQPPG